MNGLRYGGAGGGRTVVSDHAVDLCGASLPLDPLPSMSVGRRWEKRGPGERGLAAATAASFRLPGQRPVVSQTINGSEFECSRPVSGILSGNWFIAQMAACVRLATRILRRIAFTWTLTVASEMLSF